MIKIDNYTLDIKNNSLNNKISVIRDNTAELLISTINKYNCKKVLEIGTGFGYSCLLIINNTDIDHLTSVEKSLERFNVAKNNLKDFKNVDLINADSKVIRFNDEIFDFVFLDGPKSNQEVIISNLLENLSDKCIIFVDNIFLNKIRDNKTSKNHIKLIEKLDYFIEWIKNQTIFNYTFYDIDDGIAILTRK